MRIIRSESDFISADPVRPPRAPQGGHLVQQKWIAFLLRLSPNFMSTLGLMAHVRDSRSEFCILRTRVDFLEVSTRGFDYDYYSLCECNIRVFSACNKLINEAWLTD